MIHLFYLAFSLLAFYFLSYFLPLVFLLVYLFVSRAVSFISPFPLHYLFSSALLSSIFVISTCFCRIAFYYLTVLHVISLFTFYHFVSLLSVFRQHLSVLPMYCLPIYQFYLLLIPLLTLTYLHNAQPPYPSSFSFLCLPSPRQ